MDGFLVNSEELYLEANKIYFKQYNLEFTEELHRQGTGKKFDKWIKTVMSIDKSGEELLRERNVVFFDLVKKKLKLLDGAENFLQMVSQNFKTALVTSSKKDYIDLVFNITGISNYFHELITGEMVSKGKPDPQCFLIGADKLKVLGEECVVFEDAPSGVMAGKNAKMKVIAVPSRFVKGDESFELADLVLDSIKEITVKIIKSLA